MKVININKNSDSFIGIALVRGHALKPFYSGSLGCYVGNLRNAMSYLSRENMPIELVKKSNLTKKDVKLILDLPKKRTENYYSILKNILEDRILSDYHLVQELLKHSYNDRDAIGGNKWLVSITFISTDEDGKTNDNLLKYLKALNSLMQDRVFVEKMIKVRNEKKRANKKKYFKKKERKQESEDKPKVSLAECANEVE